MQTESAAAGSSARGDILIIDDDPAVLQMCRRGLQGLESCVETAGGRRQALEILGSRRFDLIISDVYMDGREDGVSLADDIRQKWPETDFLMITGEPSLDTAIPAFKNGAFEYLVKPFAPALLAEVVTRRLERRRLSKELDREKSLRKELQAAYAELQKVERLKDAFLSRLNHELRTPLAVALSAAEILVAKDGAEEMLEILQRNLQELAGIIRTLLLFKDIKGGLRPDKKAADLAGILGGTVESLRPLWKERALAVEVTTQGRAEPLEVDAQLMETAFKHLLLNAIRFNLKGGAVRICLDHLPNEVRVCFMDTGIGVPAEAIPKLFDGFYQAADYMTRKVGGLGLGLATVRAIVEAHGGDVSVASKPESGSSFTISLPRKT